MKYMKDVEKMYENILKHIWKKRNSYMTTKVGKPVDATFSDALVTKYKAILICWYQLHYIVILCYCATINLRHEI